MLQTAWWSELESVPECIGELKKLRHFRMGSNPKLKSMPASLWRIPSLRSVDLWGNAFENGTAFGNINLNEISPYLSVVFMQPTQICRQPYFNNLPSNIQTFINKYDACFQPCDYTSAGFLFFYESLYVM